MNLDLPSLESRSRALVVGRPVVWAAQARSLAGVQATYRAGIRVVDPVRSLGLQAQSLNVQACCGGPQFNVLMVLGGNVHQVTFSSRPSAPDGGKLPHEDTGGPLALRPVALVLID